MLVIAENRSGSHSERKGMRRIIRIGVLVLGAAGAFVIGGCAADHEGATPAGLMSPSLYEGPPYGS
jgi:hypothetical protein